MSADNWTRCPKCEADDKAKVEKLRASLDTLYGTVSAVEYRAAEKRVTEQIVALAKPQNPDRFREDYEIGVHKGRFCVDYRGACDTCSYVLTFKHEQAAP